MPTPQRLPIVNSDDGTWGDILRQYLMKEHYNDDTDNAVNGGHKTITIRAGTASAGTAPLKFTSGTLLTTPEAGAMEFAGDNYYLTQTSGTTRKKVAMYDDSSGATGDIYYRDASGYFTRLPIGSSNYVLTVSSGLPSWQPATGGTTLPVADTTAVVKNATDNTKQLKFDLSGLTTGTTRTLTVPDADMTLVGTATAQTLTNKTISGASNTLSNIALSSLATTGTASSSTYLRGDGAWTNINAVYTTNIGDGSTTSFVVTHNLGTRSVATNVYDATTYQEVNVDTYLTSTNSITLTFATAPATNAYVCVITGGSISTTINSTDVADSTATGRSLLTASSASAARTAISAISATSTDTLQNKTIDNTNTVTIKDANWTMQDDGDTTKQLKFQLSGITTGNTRTLTIPDASTTLVGTDTTQTLTNKTISGSSNTILNIPTSALTLSGTATANVAATESTTSTTYTDLTTVGPSVTVNIGASGTALVFLGCSIANNTNGQSAYMGFTASGANTIAASDQNTLQTWTYGTSYQSLTAMIPLTGLTPGVTTFLSKYKANGGTGQFQNRRITVIPL